MAKYHDRGPGPGLFAVQAGGSLKGRLLYTQSGQFGLINSDGSKTYYYGSGLAWDSAAGHFTAGTISAIYHYSSSGAYVDGLSGLSLGIATLEPLLTTTVSTASSRALQTVLFGGDDTLHGDAGNDTLDGCAGADIISSGSGNDILTGGTGADMLYGGDGRDEASYRYSEFGIAIDLSTGTTSGGDATGDHLTGIEMVEGSKHVDSITGDARDNALFGLGGGDQLHGDSGDDRIEGGGGRDFITGSDGIDLLLGGNGNDLIDAGTGCDIISGGAGNDVIYGGPDPDVIVYDFAWKDLHVHYEDSDYSIWVEAPDGTDHVFTALTYATATGTYRYDVPTAEWVFVSAMTGADWIAQS